MKFKYTGDHDSITMYGITFHKGESVEVDEKAVAYRVRQLSKKTEFNVLTVDKLKGNPDFEQVKPGPKPKLKAVSNGDRSESANSGS